MSKNKQNIFNNVNIKETAFAFADLCASAIQKFWETDVDVKLFALNDFRELRDELLISKVDFFSSQIKVQSHKPIIIRLSKDFVENFLNEALNNEASNFALTNLTQLEIKILNNFCEFLYKKIKEALIPSEKVKISEKSEKMVNILLCVKNKAQNISNILISIPSDRINFKMIKKVVSFTDEVFLNCKTQVKIVAGKSKLTLDELKNLAVDDIVLLENSNISKLTLISGEMVRPFSVKPNPALIMNLNEEENEEINNNEVIMSKNLWDDIQIEISAEFEKVKMTIGELKQITQGQVVDLGSVFDNEISLYVEDKKVAKGELIIINDRYAVRLDEVLNSAAKPQVKPQPAPQAAAPQKPQPQQAKPQAQPQAQAKPKPQAENEEFDYSDFEK